MPLAWKTFIHSHKIWKDMYHFFRAAHAARILFPLRDSIHIHATFASLPARYACTASVLLGTDYSISAHARDVLVNTDYLRDTLFEAELIIFCTQSVMNETCSRHRDLALKSECIYHGIPMPEPSVKQFSRKKLCIAAAGRFVEKKGFEFLIRACRILKEKKIDINCTIAGDGPLRGEYTKLAYMLEVSDIVDFPGFLDREELDSLWRKSDVICVPSVRALDGDMDGIPNVILEAGAYSVPVVASALPGICEAVQDGYNGLCVPPGSEENLARSLQKFMKFPLKKKKEMGEHARQKTEDMFDISKNIQEWIDTFKRRGIGL